MPEIISDVLKNDKPYEPLTDTAASEVKNIILCNKFSLQTHSDGLQWSVIMFAPAFDEITFQKLLKTPIWLYKEYILSLRTEQFHNCPRQKILPLENSLHTVIKARLF